MADFPAIPDYTKLAQQTQQSNQQAMNQQTLTNRPNQTNQSGSLQWTQDPTTGQWTQTQSYNPNITSSLNSQQGTQAGLLSGAEGMVPGAISGLQKPIDYSGLTGVQSYDPSKFNPLADSGFGAVQQVQDAMMSRLQPGLDQGRASLIQQLRSQGLSQGSDAYDRAIRNFDQKDNDARQQALLSATSAYGDIFNRSLANRQQQSSEANTAFSDSSAQRAAQLAEQDKQRNQGLTDLKGLLGTAGAVSPQAFAGFNTGGNAGGVDYYGAGKDSYGDVLDAYNAQSARSAANRQSNINLGTNVLGGLFDTYGDDIGGYLKGLFGG